MSGHNQQPEPARLEQGIEALRSTPVPDGPSRDLMASTLAALESHVAPPSTIRTHERRQLMFRIARYSGIAAAVLTLAGLAGFLWLFDRTAALTFADVVQKVKNAKTVSFTVKQRLGNQPELESKMSIRDDIIRYELADVIIMIVDTSKRKGIELDLTRKVAKTIDLEGRIPVEILQNPIEQLRNLKENNKDQVEQQNDEELDGHKCQVYLVKGAKAGILPDRFKLWVDAKTGLPVKIHATDDDGKTSLLFENFAWDKPLADDLFSLTAPKGFTLESFTPAHVTPGRIYYQKRTDLHLIDADGKNAEREFIPQVANAAEVIVSDRSELSPDGRYLAIGFTSTRARGSYPPDRVLLWDRTHPTDKPAEIHPRPEAELQGWQWSADGARLYVSWWEAVPGQKEGPGRYAAALVDVKTKAVEPLKLPSYKDANGKEQAMRFAAASADRQTYLVVGQGLHVATAEGKLLRRIGPASLAVVPGSVRISPDGNQVLFTTFHVNRSQQLFVASLAGGEPKELLPANQMTEVRARWSPDGKRIAYTCWLFDSQNRLGHGKETYLRLINPDGTNLATLLTEQVYPGGSGLELIAWR
jgi:outer membrane lipoprotein-sorting protein